MKTIKNVQLMVLMLGALYTSGFNTIPNQTTLLSTEVVEVSKKVRVLIKNSRGKVVLRGKMKANQPLSDLFQLDHLPSGDYIIEKIYEHKIEYQIFKVEMLSDFTKNLDADANQPVRVVFGKTYETFKPVMMNRGNLIYVSKMAFKEEELMIKVYNERNELIFTETFKNTGRIYDFSQAKDDVLRFVVTDGHNKYTESFKF